MDSTNEKSKRSVGTDEATCIAEQHPTEPGEERKWKLVSAQGKVAYESDLDGIHLWSRSRVIDDLEVEDHIGCALEHLQRAWHKKSHLNDCIRRATATLEDLYLSVMDEDEAEEGSEYDRDNEE